VHTAGENCSDDEVSGFTRVKEEHVTIVPHDMEVEEICCTTESKEERGKVTAAGQGAGVLEQQHDEAKGELRENFGVEFPNFQIGDDVNKVEADDEIPKRLAINVSVKGGGTQGNGRYGSILNMGE
jgi:hypothetical protein